MLFKIVGKYFLILQMGNNSVREDKWLGYMEQIEWTQELNPALKLGIMAHACNPSTLEVEAGLQVLG
jgi:hypothetical protein